MKQTTGKLAAAALAGLVLGVVLSLNWWQAWDAEREARMFAEAEVRTLRLELRIARQDSTERWVDGYSHAWNFVRPGLRSGWVDSVYLPGGALAADTTEAYPVGGGPR